MNPTNFECPSDITRFVTTDYRPSKALYENVLHNNNFRLYCHSMVKKNPLEYATIAFPSVT